jgi:hypothetical protein
VNRRRGEGCGDDRGTGPAVGCYVAVFGEALVGLGDYASGDVEFGGEQAGGGEAAADGEAAVGDRGAELFGQPAGQTARGSFGEGELEEVGTGFGPVG